MKLLYRVLICSAILLCTASIVLAQWQSIGAPAIEQNAYIGGAAGTLIIQQAFYARPIWVSSDGANSWQSSADPTGWPLPYTTDLWSYCGALTGADTVIFAVRLNQQICKSTDFGRTWTRCDSNLNRTDLNSLAFSPGRTSLGVLIAGTSTAGLFVSLDGGVHWTAANTGLPTLSMTSLAASNSAFLVGTSTKGLFRSTDNGVSWSSTGTGVLDSTTAVAGALPGWFSAYSGKTLYTSSNDGISWAVADTVSLPAPILSLSLIATPGNGRGCAAFAFTSAGIYRLLGTETTWQKVNTPTSTPGSDARCLAASGSILCYLEPTHIYRSADLGTSWEWIPQSTGGVVGTGRSPKGDSPSALYALNRYVLSFSTDQGISWRGLLEGVPETEGPGYLSTFSMGNQTAPGNPPRLLVGTTQPGGVRRSEDGGKTWQTLLSYPHGGLTCLNVLDLDTICYANIGGMQLGRPYKSTDGGATWDTVNWGPVADTGVVGLFKVPTQAGGRVLFWNNWYHLYRSSDDGASWTESVFQGQGSSGRRLFATVGGTLYLANGGTMQVYYDDQGNQTNIYDSAAVYRSTDDGVTWENVTGNLKAGFIRGLGAAASKEYPSRVFLAVSTVEDVWTSTEGGTHWTRMNKDGLPTVNGNPPREINQPLIADADYIYLSSSYRPYRRPWTDATITGIEDGRQRNTPVAFSLGQNYPNPFNPATTIEYVLPHRSHVAITVFNTLGQRVATLVNGETDAGYHTVRFDGTGLTSGVYFYRLQAKEFVQTKKLILLH